MSQHSIASLINFCTNDQRFLKECVKGVRPFSHQIIISVCDHFFNGEEENYALLEAIFKEYSDCTFIEFAFDPQAPYGRVAPLVKEDLDAVHHWHNSGRFIPYFFLNDHIDYIFFVDADEITEGPKFEEWLHRFEYQKFSALRFASYWYFREAKYRATEFADTSLLVKKKDLRPELILNPDERLGLFHRLKGNKRLNVFGLDGAPMSHHFSWVRSKEEMLMKTRCWGHHWERDWEKLIEEEYSREFGGRDFIRRYEYITVDPFFDPLSQSSDLALQKISLAEHVANVKQFDNVKRVTSQDIFRIELKFALGMPHGPSHRDSDQLLQQ